MTKQEISEKVISILKDITENHTLNIDGDTDLFTCDVLDSLSFLQFIISISDEFKIDVTPAQVERMDLETINKTSAFIENKLNNK